MSETETFYLISKTAASTPEKLWGGSPYSRAVTVTLVEGKIVIKDHINRQIYYRQDTGIWYRLLKDSEVQCTSDQMRERLERRYNTELRLKGSIRVKSLKKEEFPHTPSETSFRKMPSIKIGYASGKDIHLSHTLNFTL